MPTSGISHFALGTESIYCFVILWRKAILLCWTFPKSIIFHVTLFKTNDNCIMRMKSGKYTETFFFLPTVQTICIHNLADIDEHKPLWDLPELWFWLELMDIIMHYVLRWTPSEELYSNSLRHCCSSVYCCTVCLNKPTSTARAELIYFRHACHQSHLTRLICMLTQTQQHQQYTYKDGLFLSLSLHQ